MAKQVINIGTAPNAGNGDPLRTGFTKTNANFTELYTAVGTIPNLGSIKISSSTIGTQGEGTSWGDTWLYLDPAGEGWSGISIPSVTAQNDGGELTIFNNKETSGAIQLLLNDGGWKFKQDNTLEFPDGTIQTTAYTGNTSISKFVAVNVSGMVSGSEDGVTWTDYDTSLTGINRVAVGPNKNVYIADNSTDNDVESLWYADTYDTQPTEVTAIAGRDFNEVKYFKSISKFIAVGDDGTAPRKPALYYSDDGVTWTTSTIDPTYFATFNTTDVSFVDVAENELGLFILSDSATVGGFFLTDITSTLDGSNHVDLSGLIGTLTDVVYTNSYYFTGWHVFTSNEGSSWYYNSSNNPRTGTFDSDWIDIAAAMNQEIGISSSTQEIVVGDVYGLSTVMISTADGQIVYWPSVPAGPFVSVPKPYTSTITGWTSSATSAITWTNVTGSGNQGTGEKFTVTGSSVTSYNDTYYIGNNGEVFTDSSLTTPLDTTGFDPFTGTATIAWSNGQYIDALHYNNGVFYAGNDDMEMFKSTNGGQTWIQVDDLAAGTGGEPFLNDIDSYITNTNQITFNGVQIRGVPSEGKTGLIKIVPSTGFEGHSFLDNGQYVQIYPTNQYDAPHIHIAAGIGAGSEGDIFLGDDNKFVQVNHNGEVSIQAYNAEFNNAYNWNFNSAGTTTLPGTIQGRVVANTYTDTTINLDVNATINKLTPIAGIASHYYLADGIEGQIMYITLAAGGETAAEDTCMGFSHARWSNGYGVINENTDVSGWMPFRNGSGGSIVLTLMFIDGHWNLPHNSFD